MKGGVLLPTFLSLLKEKWVATKEKPQNSNSREIMSLLINQQPETTEFKFPKSYLLAK